MTRLIKTVEALADLRIATLVGDIEIVVDQGKASLATGGDGSPRRHPGALASINLASGDIVNSISSTFFENSTFMTFHKEQVEIGRRIVETNVATISELARAAGQSIGSLLGGTEPRNVGDSASDDNG